MRNCAAPLWISPLVALVVLDDLPAGMANPSPVPSPLVVTKGSKIGSRISGAMPAVILHENRVRFCFVCGLMRISPALGHSAYGGDCREDSPENLPKLVRLHGQPERIWVQQHAPRVRGPVPTWPKAFHRRLRQVEPPFCKDFAWAISMAGFVDDLTGGLHLFFRVPRYSWDFPWSSAGHPFQELNRIRHRRQGIPQVIRNACRDPWPMAARCRSRTSWSLTWASSASTWRRWLRWPLEELSWLSRAASSARRRLASACWRSTISFCSPRLASANSARAALVSVGRAGGRRGLG